MHCRTHNRPQCCSITTAQPAVNLWSQDSGSRSAWRSSISYGIDLHTRTHRERYVRTGRHCLFPGHVSMLSMPLPCLSMPRSCPSAHCHAHPGVPCHAMPRRCHALPRPCLSLVAPNPPSLRLTFPQSPVQPSRRSAHKQDFTWVSELLQTKCPVPPRPALSCPAK